MRVKTHARLSGVRKFAGAVVLATTIGLTTATPAGAHSGYPDSPSNVYCYNNSGQIKVNPVFSPMTGYSSQHVTSRAFLQESVSGRWVNRVATQWHATYTLRRGYAPKSHTFTGANAGSFRVVMEIAWWKNGAWSRHYQYGGVYRNVDNGYTSNSCDMLSMW